MMKEYRKKNYTMKAEKVATGTELYNFLEDCHYTTNDAKCIKLIGTVGEVWPVTIEKLAKTYTLIDGTPITPDNIPEASLKSLQSWMKRRKPSSQSRLPSRFRLLPAGAKSSQPIVMVFPTAKAISSLVPTRADSRILMTDG